MAETIPKYLEDRDEWEVEHWIQHARDGSLPLNPKYRAARNKALEDAGLEPDMEGEPVPIEDQDVAEHVERIRRNR